MSRARDHALIRRDVFFTISGNVRRSAFGFVMVQGAFSIQKITLPTPGRFMNGTRFCLLDLDAGRRRL